METLGPKTTNDQSAKYRVKLFWLLCAAATIRAVLLVSGHGFDLGLYMKMGDLWARGTPPYTSKLLYVYPPFYVYAVGLARLISGGSPFAYATLIKLPLVIADFFAGLLIIKYVLKKTGAETSALAAGALYLFNPLILYNTAYYGRLDQFCVFFAVAALYTYASPVKSSIMLAMSACAKTVPVFLYPYYLKDFRRMIIAGAILAALAIIISLPFILIYHNGHAVFEQVFLNIDSTPRGLSFQVIFYKFLPTARIISISKYFLLAFIILLLAFPKRDFLSYCSFVFVAFPLFSKAVHEQYVTWAVPFLIMDYFINKKRYAPALAALLTLSGLLNAELFGGRNFFAAAHLPQSPYNVLLALALAAYLAVEYNWLKKQPA